ncbi:MAG: porin [Cycloclasticus sp.]
MILRNDVEKRKTWLLVLIFFLCLMVSQQAIAVKLELFGTVSAQLESVSPDTQTDQDYYGFRSAYTRLALRPSHEFDNGLTLSALLELPFDIANGKVQQSWDQDQDIFDSRERLAKIQIDSPKYGSVWVGRDFEPYYNEISSVVVRFSSYYTAFATFSAVRVDQAIAYSSPNLNGFKINLMYSHDNGNQEANGGYDNRQQATLSYTSDDSKFGFGVTDLGGENDSQIYGISYSKQLGNFYFATKYEIYNSDIKSERTFGHDGAQTKNIYAEYTKGLHTFKTHIAKVDNFGEHSFHIGYEYQLNESTKIYTEFYKEQTGAAISTKSGGYRDTYWADGGSALLIGFSYAFSKALY